MKKKVLIICANYYPDISSRLRDKAEKYLRNQKFDTKYISVPGIFEIPVVISKNVKKFDAFVALGCVIKGKTPHFDYIIRSTFDALIHISMKYKKPVGNGIITALNKSQATSRSSNMVTSNLKNKGLEAAKAVIEIIKK